MVNLKCSLKYLLVVIGIGLAFPTQALALKTICEMLFREETVIRGELYRIHLLHTVHDRLNDAQKRLADSQSAFFAQIHRRESIRPENVMEALKTSRTLRDGKVNLAESFKDAAVPAVRDETIQALESLGRDPDAIRKVLDADPYFTWLKHNALPHKDPSKSRIFQSPTRSMLSSGEKVNPVSLYIWYIHYGYSPETSLIRVMRNLDPTIHPMAKEAVRHADTVASFAKEEKAIREYVLPFLERRFADQDVWNLTVPKDSQRFGSAKQARLHLATMQTEVIEKFGRLFTRRAYERVLKMSNDMISLTTKYTVKKNEGLSDGEVMHALESELTRLRAVLGLGDDIAPSQLFKAVERTHHWKTGAVDFKDDKNGSYIAVLASVFAPEEAAQIERLRKIVEIGDAFQTMEGARMYLQTITELENF